jgi:hypothetical protein
MLIYSIDRLDSMVWPMLTTQVPIYIERYQNQLSSLHFPFPINPTENDTHTHTRLRARTSPSITCIIKQDINQGSL